MIDSTSLFFLIAVIFLALAFDFANGFNDAANAIATVVSTRVMSPLQAVLMAGAMNFLGAISGTAVAKAVGKGVVSPDEVTLVVVAGGVAAAAAWVFLASRLHSLGAVRLSFLVIPVDRSSEDGRSTAQPSGFPRFTSW